MSQRMSDNMAQPMAAANTSTSPLGHGGRDEHLSANGVAAPVMGGVQMTRHAPNNQRHLHGGHHKGNM